MDDTTRPVRLKTSMLSLCTRFSQQHTPGCNYSPWGWSSHNTKCCAYTQKYKWMGELENNRICAGKTQCTTVFRSNPTVMARGGSRLHTTIRPFHLTPERLGRKKEKKKSPYKQNESTHTTDLMFNNNNIFQANYKKNRLLVENS